jgi:hypothetical protein
LERQAGAADFDRWMAEERERSADYGGRSVFGWEPPALKKAG